VKALVKLKSLIQRLKNKTSFHIQENFAHRNKYSAAQSNLKPNRMNWSVLDAESGISRTKTWHNKENRDSGAKPKSETGDGLCRTGLAWVAWTQHRIQEHTEEKRASVSSTRGRSPAHEADLEPSSQKYQSTSSSRAQEKENLGRGSLVAHLEKSCGNHDSSSGKHKTWGTQVELIWFVHTAKRTQKHRQEKSLGRTI
jgi:hypothetical protein